MDDAPDAGQLGGFDEQRGEEHGRQRRGEFPAEDAFHEVAER